MSMEGVQAEGIITKQGRIKRYGIELSFSLDRISLDFEGYLANPKSLGNRAMLDSFNEKMRNNAFDFIEENELKLIDGDEEKNMTGNILYHTIMDMIIESVNQINDDGESLFLLKISDSQLRKVRREREDKIEEKEKIQEQIKEIEATIEQEKAKKKAYEEAAEKLLGENAVREKQQEQPKKKNKKNSSGEGNPGVMEPKDLGF